MTYETFLRIVHPDDRQYVDTQWNKGLRGAPYDIEHRIVVDSQVKWVREKAYLEFDTAGKLLGGFGITQDITERKEMEEELARLASFPQLNPNPVIEVDLTGHIHYSNPAAEQLFPDLKNAGLQHPWLMNLDKIGEVLKTEERKILDRELRVDDHWYQQTVHSVLDGTRLRIYGFDITGRKQTEEALRRSESVLRTVLDSSPAAIFLKDRESRLLLANPATFAVIGKPAEEVIGKTDAEFYANAEIGRTIMENDQRIMNSGRTEVIEETVYDPGGTRVFLATKAPYYDAEGRVVGLIGVAREITERKQMEEELRRSRDELEIRVQERTAELAEAIESLKVEIAERKKAEERVREERKRFNDVLETLPAYVCLLTSDYQMPFTNKVFRDRFSYYPDKRCYEFLFGRSEPCETCETYTALKNMSSHQWEWTGPDGRNYDVFDFPFTDTDGSTLILEMGIDITERKRGEEDLRKAHDQVRFFASQCLIAQETERKRIAREIHDSIGQTLAAIKFALQSKLSQMGGGAAPPGISIENIISMAQNGIDESRKIQMDLRPSILDDLGILATIGWFNREFQKVYAHISIENQISVKENEIPDSFKIVIFRILQEAMNNVAKYSEADLVRLTLSKVEGKLKLTIEDNGKGFIFENIRPGMGLTSMRERAELSGGTFGVESTIGKGTTIKVSWTI
jgi:PAS domain S-box-containing protein